MVTQGGVEQQTPPQAMVITLEWPLVSYDPTHQTGVGKISVLAPNDFFMKFNPFNFCNTGVVLLQYTKTKDIQQTYSHFFGNTVDFFQPLPIQPSIPLFLELMYSPMRILFFEDFFIIFVVSKSQVLKMNQVIMLLHNLLSMDAVLFKTAHKILTAKAGAFCQSLFTIHALVPIFLPVADGWI